MASGGLIAARILMLPPHEGNKNIEFKNRLDRIFGERIGFQVWQFRIV